MQKRNQMFSVFAAILGMAPLAASAQVYSNGGLNPQAVSTSGVAAPMGTFWSEVQADAGNTTESNTSAGYSPQQGTFRLADDFVVPSGQTRTLTAVEFFAYQTGAPATPSPFAAYTLQIWNGRPGDSGATVVFGDTTTNRLLSSVDSMNFRIFNSSVPPPGSATGTTRRIWVNRVAIDPPLELTEGTYWLDWASTATNAGVHFQPAVTVNGARALPGWNARQFVVANTLWQDVFDAGNPTTAPDLLQDFPFNLYFQSEQIHSDGFETLPTAR